MKAVFIDIGSTYIKYRFNRGNIEKIPFPMRRARQPFFEADAEEISAAVQGILNKFPFADAAFFSVQMHGYVLRKKTENFCPTYPGATGGPKAFRFPTRRRRRGAVLR